MKKALLIDFGSRFGGSERHTLRRATILSTVCDKITILLASSEVAQHFKQLKENSDITIVVTPNEDKKTLVKKLKEIIKSSKPDFVYCPNKSFYFHSVLYSRRYGVKRTSLYFGGSDMRSLNMKKFYALYMADAIAVNSPQTLDKFRNLLKFGNKDKVQLILNTVNTPSSKKNYKEELGLNGKKVIGLSGGFTHQKGMDRVPKIVEIFKDRNIHFLIAGDGVLKDQVVKELHSKNLTDKVTLLGHIHDISKFYNTLDCFLLCSRDEGMPNVVMEAISHKVPVVSSLVNGIEFLLNNGDLGPILPQDKITTSQIKEAILHSMEKDDEELEKTAKLILKRHSQEQYASKSILLVSGLSI